VRILIGVIVLALSGCAVVPQRSPVLIEGTGVNMGTGPACHIFKHGDTVELTPCE